MRFDWRNGLWSKLNLGRPRSGDSTELADVRPKSGSNGQRRRRALETRLGGFELLEDRCLLAVDFGDAPDTGIGSGPGNYRTLSNDSGPRHTIIAGLRLGASVDGFDGGVLQNAAANADDVNGALPG